MFIAYKMRIFPTEEQKELIAKTEGKDYEFKQIKVEEFPQYKNEYDCMIYGLQEKGYLSRIKDDIQGFPCCEVDMTAFATKNPTKVFAQIEAMRK